MASLFNFTTLSPLTGILLPNKNSLELPNSKHIPVLYYVPYGALNVLVILLNAVCLFVFAKKPSLRVRNSNLLLMSLATADLLVGFTSLYYLSNVMATSLDDFTRRISTLVLGFALETSMLSLISLTYERLVAIWKPLEYKAIFTRCRVYMIIVITWILSIATALVRGIIGLCLKRPFYFTVNRILFTVLPILISTFLLGVYGYLFYEIHRHSKQIKRQTVSSASATPDQVVVNTKDGLDELNNKADESSGSLVGKGNSLSPRHLSREKKSLILCCCVVIIFIFCWLPVTVFLWGKLLKQEYLSQDYLLYLSTFLVSLNSFLDPCFYFAIRRDFRHAAAPFWRCTSRN